MADEFEQSLERVFSRFDFFTEEQPPGFMTLQQISQLPLCAGLGGDDVYAPSSCVPPGEDGRVWCYREHLCRHRNNQDWIQANNNRAAQGQGGMGSRAAGSAAVTCWLAHNRAAAALAGIADGPSLEAALSQEGSPLRLAGATPEDITAAVRGGVEGVGALLEKLDLPAAPQAPAHGSSQSAAYQNAYENAAAAVGAKAAQQQGAEQALQAALVKLQDSRNPVRPLSEEAKLSQQLAIMCWLAPTKAAAALAGIADGPSLEAALSKEGSPLRLAGATPEDITAAVRGGVEGVRALLEKVKLPAAPQAPAHGSSKSAAYQNAYENAAAAVGAKAAQQQGAEQALQAALVKLHDSRNPVLSAEAKLSQQLAIMCWLGPNCPAAALAGIADGPSLEAALSKEGSPLRLAGATPEDITAAVRGGVEGVGALLEKLDLPAAPQAPAHGSSQSAAYQNAYENAAAAVGAKAAQQQGAEQALQAALVKLQDSRNPVRPLSEEAKLSQQLAIMCWLAPTKAAAALAGIADGPSLEAALSKEGSPLRLAGATPEDITAAVRGGVEGVRALLEKVKLPAAPQAPAHGSSKSAAYQNAYENAAAAVGAKAAQQQGAEQALQAALVKLHDSRNPVLSAEAKLSQQLAIMCWLGPNCPAAALAGIADGPSLEAALSKEGSPLRLAGATPEDITAAVRGGVEGVGALLEKLDLPAAPQAPAHGSSQSAAYQNAYENAAAAVGAKAAQQQGAEQALQAALVKLQDSRNPVRPLSEEAKLSQQLAIMCWLAPTKAAAALAGIADGPSLEAALSKEGSPLRLAGATPEDITAAVRGGVEGVRALLEKVKLPAAPQAPAHGSSKSAAYQNAYENAAAAVGAKAAQQQGAEQALQAALVKLHDSRNPVLSAEAKLSQQLAIMCWLGPNCPAAALAGIADGPSLEAALSKEGSPLRLAGATPEDITAAVRGGVEGVRALLEKVKLPAAPQAPAGASSQGAAYQNAYKNAAAAVAVFATAQGQYRAFGNAAGVGHLQLDVLDKHSKMRLAVCLLREQLA